MDNNIPSGDPKNLQKDLYHSKHFKLIPYRFLMNTYINYVIFGIIHALRTFVCSQKEKFVLKVWKPLVAKSGDKSHKQPKRQFRLPFILREFNEEEVPIELMQSEEEEESDGEGEVSSDGVENLLSNSKSKGRWSKAKSFGELVNTKALVQVLEEELGV